RDMLAQEILDQPPQGRVIDLMLDDVVNLLEQIVGRIFAILDQVEEVVTVADVLVGRGADRQEIELHAVAQIIPAADLDAIRHALDPGLRLLEEPVVGPEGCLEGHALVAEQALGVRLVRLGHALRLLDEGREARRLLAVDEIRQLDHDSLIPHHREPPFPAPWPSTLPGPMFPVYNMVSPLVGPGPFPPDRLTVMLVGIPCSFVPYKWAVTPTLDFAIDDPTVNTRGREGGDGHDDHSGGPPTGLG